MVTAHSAMKPRCGSGGAYTGSSEGSGATTSTFSGSTAIHSSEILVILFDVPPLGGTFLKVPRLSTTAPISISQSDPQARRNSLLLVFACTVLGSAAQLLIKTGMNHFSPHLAAILSNLPLIAGYSLYGINTLMMVLALRNGEMSLLYPIIALTYVWTTLASYALLGEHSNIYKNVGIATIVVGVAVMGRRGNQ
jgi:multidrug transporter EmrE-like cation transporter